MAELMRTSLYVFKMRLVQMMIPCASQHNVNNLSISFYLPDQKTAIAIDERIHADRDPY